MDSNHVLECHKLSFRNTTYSCGIYVLTNLQGDIKKFQQGLPHHNYSTNVITDLNKTNIYTLYRSPCLLKILLSSCRVTLRSSVWNVYTSN